MMCDIKARELCNIHEPCQYLSGKISKMGYIPDYCAFRFKNFTVKNQNVLECPSCTTSIKIYYDK